MSKINELNTELEEYVEYIPKEEATFTDCKYNVGNLMY